jgi:hypothetical protein
MISHHSRRTDKLEKYFGEHLTYRECGEMTCQILLLMRDALLQSKLAHRDVFTVMQEMTHNANKVLAPIGSSIAWTLPDYER